MSNRPKWTPPLVLLLYLWLILASLGLLFLSSRASKIGEAKDPWGVEGKWPGTHAQAEERGI